MKMLFVGFATIDQIDGQHFPGGAAGAMAINASYLGIEASLLAPLSQDKNGLFYQSELRKAKVDFHLCGMESPSIPTCLISDVHGAGSSRIWQDNGALEYFEQQPIPDEVNNFDAVFLANALADVAQKVAEKITERTLFYIPGPKSVSTPHWVRPAVLQKTQVVFCNEEESPAVWEADPFKHGVPMMVVTAGSKGGRVFLADGTEIPYQPAPVEAVVDTTGAGDAWALGFALEWLKTHDTLQSITVAKALSARSVSQLGTLLSIEIEENII